MPVLLLAWRRPEMTRQVIDAIRVVAPTRMYVASDGPRSDRAGEAEEVRACRELIERAIDWPCTVERLYRDSNLGCRRAVSGALDWFFERVQEGIVLEDDCLPHEDFFAYCATLLDRYRDDSRVWCISGDNFQDGHWRGSGSYYFSRYNHCWGWASWRRAWRQYDAQLASWPVVRASGLMTSVFEDPVEAAYWDEIWQALAERGVPDTWDYQWAFTCMVNSGLTALPNRNLVRNIGFGENATHTINAQFLHQQPVKGILPLTHPLFVIRDRAADAHSFDYHFGGAARRRGPSVLARLRSGVRRLLGPLTSPGAR